MSNVGANFFRAYLASELTEGGSETEIFLDRITTLTGETITTANFSTFGRGTITLAPTVADSIECASFTGVDATAVSLTGAIRGLSALSDSVVTANKKYHPVGTQVIIAFGVHNLNDLTTYIASLVTGSIGTATDLVGGSTKITEGLGSLPRAMAALVSEQTSPNMTLKVNPFAIAVLDSVISYTGGNTATLTAPVTNPRIDLVVYSTTGSAIAVRAGSEGVSPSEPTPTTGDIVLCSIYHRVGETTLRERDISPNTQGYIKRWYTPVVYRTDIATQTYVGNRIKFGGTGTDGALTLTSGTTTLDLGSAAYFEKNYTSISITGTGKLAFSNPNTNGTIIVIKSQGAVTLTSSTSPCIDASGMGSAAGAAASGTVTATSASTARTSQMFNSIPANVSNAGGAAPISTITNVKALLLAPGCGGGGGGQYTGATDGAGGGGGASIINNGTSGGASGGNTGGTASAAGGRGGGALYIECAGTYTNTSATVSVAGVAGSNSASNGSGAGGGGAGGTLYVLYNTLGSDTGTYTVTGGAGGTNANGQHNGGAGATGYSSIGLNTQFA